METTMMQIQANIPDNEWHSYIFKLDPAFTRDYFSKALNVLSPWCLINIRNSEGFFNNVTEVINSMVNDELYKRGRYFVDIHGVEQKRSMEIIVQSLLEEYDIKYGSIPALTIDLFQRVSEEQAAAEAAAAEVEAAEAAEVEAAEEAAAAEAEEAAAAEAAPAEAAPAEAALSAGGRQLTRRTNRQFIKQFKKRLTRRFKKRLTKRTNRLTRRLKKRPTRRFIKQLKKRFTRRAARRANRRTNKRMY